MSAVLGKPDMKRDSRNEITMKIAVPLFGDRVSPHFGASSQILMIETRDGKIFHKARIDTGAQDPGEITRRLVSSGVDQLVCGGIHRVYRQWLTRSGVRVLDNQKGPAEALVIKMIESGSKKRR